ncbi:SPOR domain-containing protein, partial [Bacillus altitudinis]
NNSTVDTSTAADDKSSVDAIVIGNEEPTRTYILQINSFDNADDADKRRAEVLMAGVDAQIVKKRLSNDQTVYQVISRAMSSPEM